MIDIAYRADLTSDELTRARSVVEAPLLSGGATAALETSEPTPPLFVFADVDQLSDQQIKEIFEGTQNGDQKGTAVLLLSAERMLCSQAALYDFRALNGVGPRIARDTLLARQYLISQFNSLMGPEISLFEGVGDSLVTHCYPSDILHPPNRRNRQNSLYFPS